MVRLNKILERIRPAGAPGAVAEGERQRGRDQRAVELAGIAHVLAEFEAEADELLAEARTRCAQIRERGQQRARTVSSGLADRLAAVPVDAAHEYEDAGREHEAAVLDETERTLAGLQARAEAEIPRLVDQAMSVIMASLPEPGTDGR